MPITYNQTGVTYDAAGYTYDGETFQPTVFPIAGVYISFTDGPYTAAPAWTEVTTYVRSITTHRGRSSDLDQFDTGTAQIVLDNRDRRFDPFYTSGPYYPNGLTPRRPIRIVGQIGGQTYEVFRGFVAGWPVTWSEAGKDSTVTIQCFDALGLMANEVVPTDWPDYYVQSLVPRRYWKCNDSQTTQRCRDTSPNPNKISLAPFGAGDRFFEDTPIAGGLVGNSTFMTLGAMATIPKNIANPVATSICFWLRFRNTPGFTQQPLYYTYQGLLMTFGFDSSTNKFTFQIDNRTNLRNYALDVGTIPANSPVFIVLTATPNAGGTPTGTVTVNLATPATTTTTAATGGVFLEEWALVANNLQEIVVLDGIITSTQAATLYAFGVGRISESTTARMQRLLDTTDWPAALESFPASPVGTVAEIGSGTGVVPELQLVADSEGGELYVSKTGVLTMTARRDVFNATRSAVSQATFTDSGVGIRYGTELNIEYDADNLKNDITVNYSGDGEVNLYSDAVITGYGAASTTIETQLDSPTSALDLATLELGVEGVLVPQISPIDVSPNTVAADWQTILGLELLDRVTFKRTPTVGNQFDRAALINAIDHQIEPGVWRTQLTLSMRYTSPETLDDPVLGRLDYNYLG